jgi:hypothetical protein
MIWMILGNRNCRSRQWTNGFSADARCKIKLSIDLPQINISSSRITRKNSQDFKGGKIDPTLYLHQDIWNLKAQSIPTDFILFWARVGGKGYRRSDYPLALLEFQRVFISYNGHCSRRYVEFWWRATAPWGLQAGPWHSVFSRRKNSYAGAYVIHTWGVSVVGGKKPLRHGESPALPKRRWSFAGGDGQAMFVCDVQHGISWARCKGLSRNNAE